MTRDLEWLHRLTESDIEPWFEPAVLTRARQLHRADGVFAPVRQGNVFAADVLGSDGFYYAVVISVAAGGIQAGCDCESEYVCEHIGAVLLNWIHNPQDFAPDEAMFPVESADHAPGFVTGLTGREPKGPDVEALALGGALPDQGDAQALTAQASQAMEQELCELLGEQTVKQLRAIARRRGWKLHGTRKDGLVDQLVQLTLDAPDMAGVVEALDDDHRLALEFLALRASAVPVPESVARKTVRSLKGRRSEKEVSATLQALQELGLVFSIRTAAGPATRMPLAVAQRVPPWPDLLVPLRDDPAQLDVRRSSPFALTEVAYQVWQYLRESPHPKKARSLPEPTHLERQWPAFQGWLNPADELAELEQQGSRFWYSTWQENISVQLLPPALSEVDLAHLRQHTALADGILDFAFSLLTSLGFVEWKYGSEIQISEDVMTAFLSYPEAKRMRVLATAWINRSGWTEMSLVLRHLSHLRLRRRLQLDGLTYGDLMQELAQARLILVMLLRRLSPGTWYGAADFRELLRRFWPDYLHADSPSSPRRWWLETADSDYPLSADSAKDWQVGYAPFATACLEGPLAWLGAVTLGYDRRGLAAFQVTDLGAYLLGLRASYGEATDEPSGPVLTVHGDGTVLAHTGYAAAGAYDLLNVAGQLETTSAQEFHYRITAATAQRAFDQGWTGQAILSELEKHSDAPVPEPLRGHILTWAEGYGQVHLYDEVTLVEFADEFALQEILASTSLAQHLVYQFSPCLVAIETDAVDGLRDELVRLGHTPRIE